MLNQLLEKLGLKSPRELSDLDQIEFRKWEEVLNRGSIAIEDCKAFLESQIQLLEQDLYKPDLTKEQDLFLKSQLRCFKMLLGFIENPEKAKEQLKNYLKQRYNL